MSYSLNNTIEKAKKDYGIGNDYLKIKEGDNRMRILSQSIPHESEYKGNKNVKFVTWVLDRADNAVKPYFMPMTILEHIASMQDDPDWGFDDVPMPYDINVKALNAGTKEVKYSVIGSPKKVELTGDEQKVFGEQITIQDFVTKLNEKQNGSAHGGNLGNGQSTAPTSNQGVAPQNEASDDISVEDIPF